MSTSASELFIVDNSDSEWKVRNYLTDWCELSKTIDIATGYFEIGALLALKDKWQQVDSIRLLMGDEVSKRTKRAFEEGLKKIATRLDASLESEKKSNDFLSGVPAVVEALRSGKIQCRVYRKDKFHAKCYLTHGRQAVIGSFGLVGSSNFTKPGLEDNVELNVQIRGNDVKILQEWYERHWDESEDITAEVLRTLPRSGVRAVFFCFRIPHPDPDLVEAADGAARWSESAGETVWLCTDPEGKAIAETPRTIADLIRSLPDTPIHHSLDRAGLSKLREKVEKELIKTHLRSLQAPIGISPVLKCWMEIS